MKKKSIYKLFLLFCAFVFCTCIVVVYSYGFRIDSAILETITTITAVIGVFSIAFQVRHSKQLEEAQFIFNITQQYINDSKFQKLLDVLENNDPAQFSSEIIETAYRYFDYFESIYILLETNVINIKMIDDMLSFRFFVAANNKFLQELVLTPHKEYYTNIVNLHRLWRSYKLKRNSECTIPFLETDLSYVYWYSAYKKNNCTKKQVTVPDDIIIREANSSDSNGILNLYQILLGNQTCSAITIAQELTNIKKDKMNHIFVACEDNKVVGTIQCTVCPSVAFNCRPHMVLEYLIVDPRHRNKGIATMLLEKANTISNDYNVSSTILVSGKDRKNAHRLYKKMGYKENVKGFRLDRD